jgi:hypothetical protein
MIGFADKGFRMIRWIQRAAKVGMGFALFHFIWVLVCIGDHVHFDTIDKWGNFRKDVGRLMTALSQPSIWFCYAAFVYLLAELVRVKEEQKNRA